MRQAIVHSKAAVFVDAKRVSLYHSVLCSKPFKEALFACRSSDESAVIQKQLHDAREQ